MSPRSIPDSNPRREVAARKAAMVHDLRAASAAAPDAIMLSVRELSAKYDLALRTVSLELQKLASEGVLYTVPRVGTFVGRPRAGRQDLFMTVLFAKFGTEHYNGVRNGFEERIAQLGATSLVLEPPDAAQYCASPEYVSPAGVFEFNCRGNVPGHLDSGLPYVQYSDLSGEAAVQDEVGFDQEDGGAQATNHLLALGHKRIAFFGLHGSQDEPGPFRWSRQREDGWRAAMAKANLPAESLAFGPTLTPDITGQREAARLVTEELLRRDDITAVVVVNAFAARGLMEGLEALGRSNRQRPAIVGFDSELVQRPQFSMHLLTAMRLPWEEIGRQAANVLWERSRGTLSGPPLRRNARMSLIPRLSCRTDWVQAPLSPGFTAMVSSSVGNEAAVNVGN